MTYDIRSLKERFPKIYSRDCGEHITLGEVVERISKALDSNASRESRHEIACDIIDRDLLFGAWGHRGADDDYLMLKDIRGAIVAAYEAGKAKPDSKGPRQEGKA